MPKTYENASDIPYDEDLPFAVWLNSAGHAHEDRKGIVIARFQEKEEAAEYMMDDFASNYVLLVDTTPKPRIPKDAEFIAWNNGVAGTMVAVRDTPNRNKPWDWWGQFLSEEDLLTEIGDREIIVLDRRSGSEEA